MQRYSYSSALALRLSRKMCIRDSHYGELGLLRLNILASDFDSPGWRIIVSNSYSAYVDVAVEVATALYKSGAPLEIHDAAKLLRILKEKDHVKLIPYTFHDYMGHHEEGTDVYKRQLFAPCNSSPVISVQ